MAFMDLIQIMIISLVAGLIGTAIMTLSQIIEMKIRNRKASFTPAIGVSKIFGINFEKLSLKSKTNLNNAVHWGYGTVWGLFMVIFYLTGLNNLGYMILSYYVVMWGHGLILLPALGLADPPWKWKRSDLYLDAFHHLILAIFTVLAYVYLISLFSF